MVKRSIPKVQGSLQTLADDLQENGLRGYAKRLRRYSTEISRLKPAPKRTRNNWPRPTPKQVLQIRTYWAANTQNPSRLSQHELGVKYGVHNDGRVSEILRGDEKGRPMYSISGYYIPPKLRKLASLEK